MRKSLKGILVLFICLSVALQIFGIWALFGTSRVEVQRAAYQYRKDSFQRECQMLDEYIERKVSAALELSYTEQLVDYMLAPHPLRQKTYGLLLKLIDNMLIDDSLIGVSLFFQDGTSLRCGDMNVPAEDIFENFGFQEPKRVPFPAQRTETYYMSWRQPIYKSASGRDRIGGTLEIYFDLKRLMTEFLETESWILLDSKGEILLSQTAVPAAVLTQCLRNERDALSYDGVDYLATAYQGVQAPYRVAALHDRASIRESHSGYLGWAISLSLLCVLCGILVMIALYRRILAPIEKIIQGLKCVEKTGNVLEPAEDGCREINFLTRMINQMLERIDRHNREEMRMQQSLHEANMRYVSEQIIHLQSQINPHFLYNNLECIRGMAACGDIRAVQVMCTAMANVYRYGTRGRQLLVSLREEAKCLREYEKIIRLRFGESYQFIFQIDSELEEIAIPRMTLQPLCENAVLHGLAGSDVKAPRVWILAKRDKNGDDTVVIEDNGIGMEAGAVEKLNHALRHQDIDDKAAIQTDRIGVFNIERRLTLLLHQDCGLRLERREGGGLRAVILLRKPS